MLAWSKALKFFLVFQIILYLIFLPLFDSQQEDRWGVITFNKGPQPELDSAAVVVYALNIKLPAPLKFIDVTWPWIIVGWQNNLLTSFFQSLPPLLHRFHPCHWPWCLSDEYICAHILSMSVSHVGLNLKMFFFGFGFPFFLFVLFCEYLDKCVMFMWHKGYR